MLDGCDGRLKTLMKILESGHIRTKNERDDEKRKKR